MENLCSMDSRKTRPKEMVRRASYLNTVGILEIFYIFHIAKKSWIEVKADFKGALSSSK